MDCPTVFVPRTNNPDDKPWQITNDLIYNAGVWRNGGSDETTHICDDCIRIGLRAIKLKVDELLGVIEADADKDAELAALTKRLADLQFHHQSLVFEHNRMQERLATALRKFENSENEDVRLARWEVSRGPAKNQWGASDAEEPWSKIAEALRAGLACAKQCPLNTTYHERVIGQALSLLPAENGPGCATEGRQP